MISIQNLSFGFKQKQVLKNIHIDFSTNSTHGIVGLNGAGKTTFFNILGKFLIPDGSVLHMNGQPWRSKDVGFLETNGFYYSKLTGREYLDVFPCTNQSFDLNALNSLLQIPLDQIVDTYSTGMKKKLSILGILKQDKPIYLFDEPFNGLDLESNKLLEHLLKHLKVKQKTIFLSSHILAPMLEICDHIHHLHMGSFVKSYSRGEFQLIEKDIFEHFSSNAETVIAQSL